MATAKASQDYCKTAREGYEDMLKPSEDYDRWREQKYLKLQSKVLARAVVDKDNRPLFDAALKGDWKIIRKILRDDPAAMMAKVMTIENESFTVLDIAIMATQDKLVDNLVKRFPLKNEDLKPERALFYAAKGGRIRMVKALVEKIKFEPKIIRGALECTADFAPTQKEVLWYLARCLTYAPSGGIMFSLITAGHLGRISYSLILSLIFLN
ncbi:hypothetical protein BT93_L0459 [Corymbia citriodora subsp. variegata]|uniref:Uncharacterized protein n=1 Tax=Corymbia citriodora subsp. variegata TaxID=360336 RepID=A0A8T0CPW7_CORYI|nr:hypothetical protein BT93_L0459 [Corymbia citriodora subsp. variegata]